MNIHDIIKKVNNREAFTQQEIVSMLEIDPRSREAALLMGESSRISRELTDNTAEVHGQFALNLAPCPVNCRFCAFAAKYGIFKEPKELTVQECVDYALGFDNSEENAAVFLMTTANYDFGKFIEISSEVRKVLRPETLMIANVGDMTAEQAKRMKDAGFNGTYHAIRMGEGEKTNAPVKNRLRTIRAFQDAGLVVGTCVEPIGPEHSNEEIAEKILLAASFDPAFSGAMRRINIPGSDLEQYGMISELRLAQIVAVTRIATPMSVLGNCTHEPNVLGAMAGANLFWAEVGGNPRDTKEKTEENRGVSVADCSKLLSEAEWQVAKQPSAYYNKKHGKLAEI